MCIAPEGAITSVQWNYVGPGAGRYDAVQSYNYVGYGAGAYDQQIVNVAYGWRIRPLCIGVTLLAIVVVVLVLVFRPEGESPFDCDSAENLSPAKKEWCCTNEGKHCDASINPGEPPVVEPPVVEPPVVGGPEGMCLVWGDPHIETFDKSRADFFGFGVAWLVRSQQVKIQARFQATPFTNGLAATNAVAISGPAIGNHVLKVGAMETGDITFDNAKILTSFPSQFDAGGFGSVSYNGEGNLVDNAQSHLQKHIVHINLPQAGVHLQVMRWSHHVNVRITMRMEQGQDGCCGNFNGNAGDDTEQQIMSRVGYVPAAQSLFSAYVPPTNGKDLDLSDCIGAARTNAEAACRQSRPDIAGWELEGCVFDACFAGAQYVEEDTVY